MQSLPPDTPLWIIIAIFIVLTFRKEIFSGIQSVFNIKAKAESDEREHQQATDDKVVESRLKLLEQEYNEKVKHETELQALLRAQTDLIARLVANELQTLNCKADEIQLEIKRQKRALQRLTDLIAVIYSRSLSKNGEVVQEVVNEIETILDEKDCNNGTPSETGDTSLPDSE